MPDVRQPTRGLAPLFLAGFTTAFGAHGVASVLGTQTDDIGMTLMGLGVVLALYDVAELVLKPVFGALSDRVGAKPIIVGGLAGFVAASLLALISPTPLVLALARLGQGASAAAFSPASSAAVARLAGKDRLGGYFGQYGAWKSVGYALGPLIGVALSHWLGIRALYIALAVIATVAAVWAAVGTPSLPVLPRKRSAFADLVHGVAQRGFLVPTLLLAVATGTLAVAVGFLPLMATRLGLNPMVGAGAVALLAVASTVVQPVVGRWRDQGRVATGWGSGVVLFVSALAVLALALWPHLAPLLVAAAVIGVMVGTLTPLGFAHLADVTPEEHMGTTMGNADMGREIGDAGGPLLIGAIAAAWALPVAFAALAAIHAAVGGLAWLTLSRGPRTEGAEPAIGSENIIT